VGVHLIYWWQTFSPLSHTHSGLLSPLSHLLHSSPHDARRIPGNWPDQRTASAVRGPDGAWRGRATVRLPGGGDGKRSRSTSVAPRGQCHGGVGPARCGAGDGDRWQWRGGAATEGPRPWSPATVATAAAPPSASARSPPMSPSAHGSARTVPRPSST